MLSAEEFDYLIEMLDTLDYFPDLEKDIAQAEREIKQGEVYSLKEVMAEEGFVLADKPRKNKNAPNSSHKNRPKRPKKSQ